MMIRFSWAIMLCSLTLVSCFKQSEIIAPKPDSEQAFINNNLGLSSVELLGKNIFFDKSLSSPEGQSCGSCHSPARAFSDPLGRIISPGAVRGLFGTRNSPMVSYNAFSPQRYYDNTDQTYVGGFFWDGRANTLEEQAEKPFFNHVEMNNADIAELVEKIKAGAYAELFTNIYGQDALDDNTVAFNYALQSIAEFEKSRQVNPFSSKYDRSLRGEVKLNDMELKGLELFNGKAMCGNCHPTSVVQGYKEVLFTDFTYDNIGLPQVNAANPIDLGLGAIVNNANENGKFKVPSLRNVAISAPYFHNGFAKNLDEVMVFYNERDKPGKFPSPEVSSTMNTDELGDLKLSPAEIKAVIAFLQTLTDGYGY